MNKWIISSECYECHRWAETSEVKRSWLHPYFVTQRDGSSLQTQLCPNCARWHLRFILKGRRIGRISNLLSPGFSSCGACHTNWQFVAGHVTRFASGKGMFPLCEACWQERRPQERLPFYESLFHKWPADGERWEDIKKTVLEGG